MFLKVLMIFFFRDSGVLRVARGGFWTGAATPLAAHPVADLILTKTKNSNLYGFELDRTSIKGTK